MEMQTLKELTKDNPILASKIKKRIRKKQTKSNKTKRKQEQIRISQLVYLDHDKEDNKEDTKEDNKEEEIQVEYVVPTFEEQIDDLQEVAVEAGIAVDNEDNNLALEEYKQMLIRFQTNQEKATNADYQDFDAEHFDNFEDEDFEGEDHPKRSRRQIRLVSRPSVAQLKILCRRPDLIELWDVCSPDPWCLTWLKGLRNSVMVPKHWSEKRRYLAGRRGADRIPYKLPEYVEDTKIAQIRASLIERDAHKTLKQKQRDKMRPRKHKLDMDYQVLHDAFFKHSNKPKMTTFGMLYFEGKEMEVKMQRYQPGDLSNKLREALGMIDNSPPPWILNMQRYGPPPSYPSLRVPSVNCPIPLGCEYGYHPGGWGKPPVDPLGHPLFGDFSSDDQRSATLLQQMGVDTDRHWGETIEGHESEDEMYKDEGDSEEVILAPEPSNTPGYATPLLEGLQSVSGLTSVGGASSVTSGLETPQSVDIRRGLVSASPLPYKVLPMQKTNRYQNSFSYSLGNKTPSGSSVKNPEEFEAEAVRKELKKHEDASKRAIAAAGQIVDERKTKKKEPKFKF